MSTRETIERYLTALQAKDGWEKHLANDMVFTNHATPVKQVTGRDAFLEATRGFYGIIDTVQVHDLLVDGNRACALTHYRLKPPSGDAFTSDVAEVFTVDNDRIDSFSIYFDTAPFPG
jgi:ketosteroid isomerase-like protein